MASLFTIADTHLSLTANKPMDIFGSRWQYYEEKLKYSWLDTVGESDTVVVPGDISWAMTLDEALEDLKFLDALPGYKIIGRGNHDYWWGTVKKMREFLKFNDIKTIDFLYNNAFETDDFIICGSRGWFNDEKVAPSDSDYNKIVAREVLRLGMSLDEGLKLNTKKESVVFLHFPPIFNDYLCPELIKVLNDYNVQRCFFGHIHGQYYLSGAFEYAGVNFNLISADYLNFIPLKIEKIINFSKCY